jgi:hypothetical protein
MDEITVPSLQNTKSISVKAHLVGTKKRAIPLPGVTVSVNEDEFTTVLVAKLTEALQRGNVTVLANSSRVVELQVVRVSIQPELTMHCVIDYNRKLGDGEFYGFQSRSNSWNFITACDEALQKAANKILSDPDTVSYLRGE